MSLSDLELRELVRRAASGEGDAVDDLLGRHRPRLRKMVQLRMDPRVLARVDPSDVIQEALTTAAEQLPDYLEHQPIPFYPWLRRIAWQQLVQLHRQHLDAAKRTVRREQRQPWGISDHSTMQLTNMLAGNASTPSIILARKENHSRVRAALAQLNDTDREVLLERYVEGLSVKEIAAGMGATEAAVYKRQSRAIEKLHQYLHGDQP